MQHALKNKAHVHHYLYAGSLVEGFFYNYDFNRTELKSAEYWSYSHVFEKLLMETTIINWFNFKTNVNKSAHKDKVVRD